MRLLTEKKRCVDKSWLCRSRDSVARMFHLVLSKCRLGSCSGCGFAQQIFTQLWIWSGAILFKQKRAEWTAFCWDNTRVAPRTHQRSLASNDATASCRHLQPQHEQRRELNHETLSHHLSIQTIASNPEPTKQQVVSCLYWPSRLAWRPSHLTPWLIMFRCTSAAAMSSNWPNAPLLFWRCYKIRWLSAAYYGTRAWDTPRIWLLEPICPLKHRCLWRSSTTVSIVMLLSSGGPRPWTNKRWGTCAGCTSSIWTSIC